MIITKMLMNSSNRKWDIWHPTGFCVKLPHL